MLKSICSILFLTLTLNPLFAEDLNWQAAERAYQVARAKADSAKQQSDHYYSLYETALSRLNTAKQKEQSAEQNYQSEQNQLVQIDNSLSELESQNANLENTISQQEQYIASYQNQLPGFHQQLQHEQQELNRVNKRLEVVERRIRELENLPHEGAWTCVYRDHGHEEHSGGHSGSDNDRSTADEKAKALCLSLHGKCDLVRCTQPDNSELQELRRQKQQLESQINNLESEINNIQTQINNCEYQINDLQSRINQNEQRIRQNNLSISSLNRQRERQVIAIQKALSDLHIAENNVSNEDANMRRAYSDYQSAYQISQVAENSAAQAYAYYEQVVANYNAALEAVYAKASSAANSDSQREALERAPEKGKASGNAIGKSEGVAKGESDGGKREFVAGFLEGLKTGASDPILIASYQSGIQKGQAIASEKAQAETFPKGFNEALRALLSAVPLQSEIVDISQNISSQAGGNGVLLKLNEKTVGSVTSPLVVTPSLPFIEPPTAGTPSISVPTALKTYFSPPCSGLVLSEFEPLCRDRYQALYLSGFDSHYRASYTSAFKSAYVATAKTAYETTLAKTFTEQLIAGKKQGASDQGLVDGFEKSLVAAQEEKFLAGKKQLTSDLGQGALLVVKNAVLEETSGDGVFTPGEKLKLSVTIDNYGLQDTALEKLRLKVKGVLGASQLNFSIRNLPALKASTRTTLTGVVDALITTSLSKEQIGLSTSLEGFVSNEWKEIAELNASSETHFPVEITDISFAKNPLAGVNTQASVTFKNLTKGAVLGAKISLDTVPNFVKVMDKESELPELQPSQEAKIAINVQPTQFVPENSYVKFVATKEGVTQGFAKYIRMDRTLGLELYDKNRKPIPSSTLKVKAGSTVQIFLKPVFFGKQPMNGPFSMKAAKPVNPLIMFGGESTIGIQWGALSPSSVLNIIPINYVIPSSLKGRTESVVVQVNEGSKITHAMVLYLEIE